MILHVNFAAGRARQIAHKMWSIFNPHLPGLMCHPLYGSHYLKMKGRSARDQLSIVNSLLIVQLSSQTNHDIAIGIRQISE